jgi:RNA polymerase sigma-70 factor (ECF subfamily)
MLAILGKLDAFPPTSLDAEDWDRLPDRFGLDPGEHAGQAQLAAAVRQAIDQTLTARQRRLFVAVVLNGVPPDAVAARLGLNRNAVYKAVFDARRKIRAFLAAKDYLEEGKPEP